MNHDVTAHSGSGEPEMSPISLLLCSFATLRMPSPKVLVVVDVPPLTFLVTHVPAAESGHR